MEQIKKIVAKTFENLTDRPEAISEFVTRDLRTIVLLDLSTTLSIIVLLRDGNVAEQKAGNGKYPFLQLVQDFNAAGKIVDGIAATTTTEDGTKKLSYLWRSTASAAIILYAVAIRSWKKFLRNSEVEERNSLLSKLTNESNPDLIQADDALLEIDLGEDFESYLGVDSVGSHAELFRKVLKRHNTEEDRASGIKSALTYLNSIVDSVPKGTGLIDHFRNTFNDQHYRLFRKNHEDRVGSIDGLKPSGRYKE